MKKLAIILLTLVTISTNVFALEGEMGYFGGISPGTKIPTGIALSQDKFELESKYTLPYKENVYLSGEAVALEGTIEIRPGEVDPDEPTGDYKETYIVRAVSEDGQSEISRSITLETQYVYDKSIGQIAKSSEVTKWVETVVVGGQTYYLDEDKSSFSKSMLEDYTPGVMYYSGDVYYDAVYENVSGDGYVTTSVESRVYGYDQAFAKSEVQSRNITVDTGDNQYFITETPTITMNKEISYASNKPQAISFAGNYKEVIQGSGALSYNVLVGNDLLLQEDTLGTIAVKDTPKLEQLTIPTLTQLAGHPAKADIEKMFSMKIFDKNPAAFSVNEVVKRGEYIKMLVKALRIPMPEIEAKQNNMFSSNKDVTDTNVFTDVDKDDALYPYLLAAYDAGLISGGKVNANSYITREEMIVFNVRAIGLERLGMGMGELQTPFLDDNKISNYSKSSIYAASKLGIIPSVNGYIFPDKQVTYAECAAFLNTMIDYLRYDLQKDYNQHMMM